MSIFLLSSLELVHRAVETKSLTESHEGWLSHHSLRKVGLISLSCVCVLLPYLQGDQKERPPGKQENFSFSQNSLDDLIRNKGRLQDWD